jgi:hypothetical protein
MNEKICAICKRKPAEKREFCQACYVRGLRLGTIQKLEKPPLPAGLTKIQQEVLIGALLGDGCLFMPKNATNPLFAITRSYKDFEYLNWQLGLFKDFCLSGIYGYFNHDKRTNKTYHQVKLTTRRAQAFNSYYESWYPGDKKQVPDSLELTPLTCAIWFCDDGCVTLATEKRLLLKLSTHGFSICEVEFLKYKLQERYNEKFNICIDTCGPYIYASDNASRAFISDIDSLIPTEMERKIKWRVPSVMFYDNITRAKNYEVINGKRQYAISNL